MRFVDAEGEDLIPRVAGNWRDASGLLRRMVEALEKAGRPVPPYLRLAASELNPKQKETACIAMYCYWTGEKNLSGMEGVLATRIGMMGRYEVIEVDFDADVVSFESVLERAKASCGKQVAVFARSAGQMRVAKAAGVKAKRSDEAAVFDGTVQKHFLKKAPQVRLLPLTEIQYAKANALAAEGKDVREVLAPSQVETMKRLHAMRRANEKLFQAAVANLEPDRTPKGLAPYAAALERVLQEVEAKPESPKPVR